MKPNHLVVKLDQYAGNVDEIVCVALTGHGIGRYGYEEARVVFDTKVKPLLSADPDDEYSDLPVEFYHMDTSYGSSPYRLDDKSTDNLALGIDRDTTIEQLNEMIDIWNKAFTNENGEFVIEVEYEDDRTSVVKVLGFDLVTFTPFRVILR